jgi:hypothetical protein
MNAGRRHIKHLCLLCLALPALAWSGPGYLAIVGPAPLRFWSPSHAKYGPVTASTNSAPSAAQTGTPDPYDIFNAFGSPTYVPTPGPMQPVAPDVEMKAASANPQPVIGQPSTVPPGDVVSPQMLLKYFNKNTNGTSTGIIAPLNMAPSSNPTPPPSSATYSN